MRRWYVVQTRPRDESTALCHLTRQGFEGYLPRFLKCRRHARKMDVTPVPLFPGYLFVALDLAAVRWRSIHGTVGVSRLVCHGDNPAPVPEGIVEDIQGREDPAGWVVLSPSTTLRQGQAVEILNGPLAELRGFFEGLDSKERIVVLLSLLGREVRARVPLGWVQATA
jgi:transcriptional antiterminator RfaH